MTNAVTNVTKCDEVENHIVTEISDQNIKEILTKKYTCDDCDELFPSHSYYFPYYPIYPTFRNSCKNIVTFVTFVTNQRFQLLTKWHFEKLSSHTSHHCVTDHQDGGTKLLKYAIFIGKIGVKKHFIGSKIKSVINDFNELLKIKTKRQRFRAYKLYFPAGLGPRLTPPLPRFPGRAAPGSDLDWMQHIIRYQMVLCHKSPEHIGILPYPSLCLRGHCGSAPDPMKKSSYSMFNAPLRFVIRIWSQPEASSQEIRGI